MFKNKIFVILISSLLLAVPLSGSTHIESNKKELYNLITSSVYKITVADIKMGTAFAISPRYLITNYHVVKNDSPEDVDSTFYPDVVVENFDGTLSFSGVVQTVDPENDFALIFVDQEMPAALYLSDHTALEPLTEVFVAGYPLGFGLIITRGLFQGETKYENYTSISAQIAPGNSGGPAIFWNEENNRYEVFGVASAVLGSYQSYPHLGLIRPVEALRSHISHFLPK